MKRAIAIALLVASCGAPQAPPSAEGRVTSAPAPLATAAPKGPSVEARAARRVGVDQFKAALIATTGFGWEGALVVSDPDVPSGHRKDPHADLVDRYAASLGKPDWFLTTSESLAPSVTFAKLTGDAARSACRRSIEWDATHAEKRLVKYASFDDTLASNRTAVRKNASYLALRFWGRSIAPDDAAIDPIATLFDAATRAATTKDGWRAVCIAMVTDPQFLTY